MADDCALLELDEISELERKSLLELERKSLLEMGRLSLEELASAVLAKGVLGLESLHAKSINDDATIADSEYPQLFNCIRILLLIYAIYF